MARAARQAVHEAGGHGEAVLLRARHAHDAEGNSGARWLRLHARLSRRADDAGREDLRDRRRHVGDSTPRHRAQPAAGDGGLTFEQVARRLRLPLGFVLAALYLAFGPQPTPLTLVVGGSLALIGLAVRGWAAGHIVKNDRLATTGPYAHTRNPLYFGSFLLAAGLAIAVHWGLLLLVIAFWVLIYAPTMERERKNIHARFPDTFPEWERNVPAFVPRPTPWLAPDAEHAPWSFPLYL